VFGVAAGLLVYRSRREAPQPVPPGPPPVSSLIAWSLNLDDRAFVAVIAIPPGRAAVALAVPGDTLIDLPSGSPTTVGAATTTPGVLLASMQAIFDQRIPHYVVSSGLDLQNLIDRVGGIRVLVEQAIAWQGQTLGPGETILTGGAALEYLESADPLDATGRWEEVLAGVLGAVGAPNLAVAPLGTTDDPVLVPSLLSLAKGAAVLELPTAVIEGSGGRRVDSKALKALRFSRFPGIGGRLVRVVVLNGNGQPGVGAEIATLLAPSGYRVVSSQNTETFDSEETQVIASTTEFLEAASQVLGLIGVGKVYVGPQPTGIADITIVVGKDYSQG
jgi:LytR cell envelope-related transcriptional attenuator/LytR_cpsA_psr family